MMKTCVAIPATVNSSRAIRQAKAAQYRWFSKRSWLRSFQYFIESTDWDDRYLCNHWVDKMCLGGIVVSALYFTTNLVLSLLK
jgi:hypothetical protein